MAQRSRIKSREGAALYILEQTSCGQPMNMMLSILPIKSRLCSPLIAKSVSSGRQIVRQAVLAMMQQVFARYLLQRMDSAIIEYN